MTKARQSVLTKKDVPLFGGLVRIVAWDPIEGVLFLHNKQLSFHDDCLFDDKGGIRLFYPVFGEELALRVPLETQTLRFLDDKVMTREYLPVSVRGAMKWRIDDIDNFYLLVSRELRATWDTRSGSPEQSRSRPGGPNAPSTEKDDPNRTTSELITSAVEWLRLFAEEQTRLVISHASSGLILAAIPEIRATMPEAAAAANPFPGHKEWSGAADSLAEKIQNTISEQLLKYGIVIEDVSLQEIRLPEEITRECIEACKTFYLPEVAKRQVALRQAQLEVEVAALGREAIAAKEIVHAAPPIGLVDFFNSFLSKRLTTIATPSATDLPAIAALAAATTPSIPPVVQKPTAE